MNRNQVAAASFVAMSIVLAGCGAGGSSSGPVTVSSSLTSSDAPVVLSGSTRYLRAYTFTAKTTEEASVVLSSSQFVPVGVVWLGSLSTNPNAPGAPGSQYVINGTTEDYTFDTIAGNTYTLGITSQTAEGTGPFSAVLSAGLSNVQEVSAGAVEAAELSELEGQLR